MSLYRILIVCLGTCAMLGRSEPAVGQGPPSALPISTPLAEPSAWTEDPSYPSETQALDISVGLGPSGLPGEDWAWQWVPDGLMYPAYLAGGRESRFASHWINEKDMGGFWDVTLGGHVGVLRYGTRNPFWPEGWQLDVEGAAFPRLTLDHYRDLVATDFRFGIPATFRRGPLEGKFGYYHLSSHRGDEHMVKFASLQRLNYVRDALVAGLAFRPWRDLRLYSEAGWAFYTDGGSQPWEFQFGVDYSPMRSTCGWPDPFLGVNARIREELDFGGNMTVQAGLQWRGQTGRLFRAGLHYFNGKTDQYQFFREHEEQFGLGLWYDF